MEKVDLQKFQKWANDNAELGHAVAMAQAFAELQRERVDAYIQPIFNGFCFHYAAKWEDSGRGLSGPIDSPKHLYLCDDEAQMALYYEACDKAHRAHGFKGPHGHCPALVAENLLMEAQRHLLKSGSELFGVNFEDVYGEQRAKAIGLLMGATIKAWSERKRRAA